MCTRRCGMFLHNIKGGKKGWDDGERGRGQEVLKELHLSGGYVASNFLLALFRRLVSFAVSYVFFGDIFKWHVSRFHTFVSLNLLCAIKNRPQRSPDKYGWFDEFDVPLCVLELLWEVVCLFLLCFLALCLPFSPHPCYLSVI